MKSVRAVFSTSMTLAAPLIRTNFGRNGDGWVALVDECSKLADYEALACIHLESYQKVRGILLAGDAEQLRNIILSSWSKPKQNEYASIIQQPLLFRLVDEGYPTVKLNECFRLSKEVVRFPSLYTYGKLLKPAKSAKRFRFWPEKVEVFRKITGHRTTNMEWGNLYINVTNSFEEMDPQTNSRYNRATAAMITKIIFDLIREGVYRHDSVIITPYQAQRGLYLAAMIKFAAVLQKRGFLDKWGEAWTVDKLPGVHNADSIQGHEAEMVFLDPVGSTALSINESQHTFTTPTSNTI